MSKAAATKTVENVEFASLDIPATDQFRAFADKGIEQSRETYTKLRVQAEAAQKTIEAAMETARAAGSEMSLKSIAAMRANADAGFSHLEALAGAKSLSELIELQTSFFRGQIERVIEQTKDLQETSSKAATDVVAPFKNAFETSTRQLRVA